MKKDSGRKYLAFSMSETQYTRKYLKVKETRFRRKKIDFVTEKRKIILSVLHIKGKKPKFVKDRRKRKLIEKSISFNV